MRAAKTNGSSRVLSATSACDFGAVGPRTGLDPIERRLRRAVAAAESRADAFLRLQLHRRQEEILQQPEVGIDGVHRDARRLRVVAEVAHVLAHVRPVLLLDVRVVVFLVGPPARELNLAGFAVRVQMGVDEFGAVVGVNAAQRERQLLAELLERFLHAHLAFPHDRAGFHPRRVDVRQVERVQEVAIGALARSD